MIIIYVLLILIAALPLSITVRYIFLGKRIRQFGINASGVVTSIHTTSMRRGPTLDRVHIEYPSNIYGHFHKASITAKHRRFKRGETVAVKYLPKKPSKILVDGKHSYWPMLIFSILIFLFAIFAVYKIDEMVRFGVE